MLGFGPLGTRPLGTFTGGGGTAPAGRLILRGSNAVSNQIFPNPGHLIYSGGMSVTVTAAPRVTWTGLEVAHPGLARARVTWIGAEALHSGASVPRVTWIATEVLRTTATQPTIDQVTWIGAEVAHPGIAAERATWIGAEVAHSGLASDRVTWIGTEVLRTVADRRADSGWVCLLTG